MSLFWTEVSPCRMSMKYLNILFISLAFVVGLFACEPPPSGGEGGNKQLPKLNLNDPNLKQIVQSFDQFTSEISEAARPNQVQAWVDKLVVKAQPGKDMPQVGMMNEGEVAEYLYQRTVSRTEYTLRGQRFYEPWILIKTKAGEMGWVHEGGVRYLEPDFMNFINEQLAGPATTPPPAPNMRTRGPATGVGTPTAPVNPARERLVIPGRQVGAIRLKTSETELIQLYGATQVARSTVTLPEGNTEDCTVVFGGDNDEIRITWKDEGRTKIKAVYFDKPNASWFTREGLHVGMKLSELTKANKSPLTFFGFNWNYGGTVSAWRNGTLKSFHRHFYVVLTPGVQGDLVNQFSGNKKFSSNDEGVPQLHAFVSRIVVYLD